jgi:hypothetical protein
MENVDPRAPFGWIPGKESYRAYRHITDCALFGANVRVTCRQCRSAKIFRGYALWWLFHRKRWDDSLQTAGRRFRCSNCCYNQIGRRFRGVDLSVTEEEPTGPQPPMPDRYVWKRLVNRHRS